ncbi:unnamed protein product, partial [Discosporangium mesarthrocarpum]
GSDSISDGSGSSSKVDRVRRDQRGKAKGKRKDGQGRGRARSPSTPPALRVVPDEFDCSVAATDLDQLEEAEEEEERQGQGQGQGRTISTRSSGMREAEEAAAAVRPVDRGGLKCGFCHQGHSLENPLPGRTVGPHPVLDGGRAVWVHDGCALFSPMVFRDTATERLCNIATEVRRGRLLTCTGCRDKGATIGCFVEKCKESYHFPCAQATGWSFSLATSAFHCRKHRKRLGLGAGGGRGGAGGARGGGGGGRAGRGGRGDICDGGAQGLEVDRGWLTVEDPRDTKLYSYLPQVGEIVMYLPQGHMSYLHSFPEASRPPYKLFKGHPPVVRCQVL